MSIRRDAVSFGLGAGLVALTLTLYSEVKQQPPKLPDEQEQPAKQPPPTIQPDSVQNPFEDSLQKEFILGEVSIEYLPSGQRGLVKGIKIVFSARQNYQLEEFSHKLYSIPEMGIEVRLHDGAREIQTKFPKPLSLNDKLFLIYGFNRYTHQPELLYRTFLSRSGNSRF